MIEIPRQAISIRAPAILRYAAVMLMLLCGGVRSSCSLGLGVLVVVLGVLLVMLPVRLVWVLVWEDSVLHDCWRWRGKHAGAVALLKVMGEFLSRVDVKGYFEELRIL